MSWEIIEGEQQNGKSGYVVLERLRVDGGYLYRLIHYAYDGCVHGVGGLTFVPDSAPGAAP